MTLTEFRTQLIRERPDVLRSLHPRTYAGADGWCPPELPALMLANQCIWAGQGGPNQVTKTGNAPSRLMNAWFVAAASKLVKLRVPTFHVCQSFLDAVTRSDTLAGVDWNTQTIPLDAGLFLLPKRDPDLPAWLGWCRIRSGDTLSIPGDWTPFTVPVAGAGFVVFAGSCPTEEHQDTFLITCREDGTFDTTNVAEGVPMTRFNYREIVGSTTSMLLAMLARPELVEHDGRRLRTMKKGPAREEWTPNWIGRTYRVQRPDGDGSHASPRLHWRRGHYRRQACGTGRKDHKIIWLEPCLVGGTADG